jgi:uncharacterized membrane protein
MGKINDAKVIIGGLVAGLIMNVIDFVANGVILGPAWQEAASKLNIDMASVETSSMFGWILYDLLMGIATVWMYAAIRPRCGAGAKTAMVAGFFTWIVTRLMFAMYVTNGIYPASIVLSSSIGSLVATLVGAYVGCMLYKEEAA